MLRLSSVIGVIGVIGGIATFALVPAAPSLAQAQDGPAAEKQAGPDFAKAKRHYEAAETAAAEGRWQDAARDYLAAFGITSDPVLFFKIGHAYDKSGDCTNALVNYRRYLGEAKPAKEFAELTSSKIAACEQKVANGQALGTGDSAPAETDAAADPAPPTVEPPATAAVGEAVSDPFGADDSPPPPSTDPLVDPAGEGQPSWQRTAGWISVAVAVGFTMTGSVLGLAASSREDDIQTDIDFRDSTTNAPARFQGTAAERYNDHVSQGEKLELAAFINFGAAGAAIAAAVVFFVIDPRTSEPAAGLSVAPTVAPGLVGLSAGWSFE